MSTHLKAAVLDWFDGLAYLAGHWYGRCTTGLRRRLRLLRYWRALRRPGSTMTTADPIGPPGSLFVVDSRRVVVGRSSGEGPYTTRVAPTGRGD